ncbi:MAG: UvrD-helicase domain-containing protein [Candidatus Lambdaproteobacteria bacterium]|nr:UvrD-helicase domain-containing protein [Candidatus Lambdaproteobacteria bacterium]
MAEPLHLNAQQRQAVGHPLERPLHVLAGPGTGKTALLAARFEHLVRGCGCAPESILCLTFGQKAAAELAHRLGGLGVAGAAREALWVHTYHQFALRLLRELALDSGAPREPALIDEEEARRLLDEEVLRHLRAIAFTPRDFRHYAADDPAELRALAAAMKDALERADLAPEALLARSRAGLAADGPGSPAEAAARQSLELAEHAAAIIARYGARLAGEGRHDYGTLLAAAVALLAGRAHLQAALRARFSAVLVDEFQDTDPVQWRLVGLVAAPGLANVTAVGDAKQSIYGWRGAGADLVFPAGRTALALHENYRSPQEILDVAERVIKASPVYRDEPSLSATRLGSAGAPRVEVALYRKPEHDERAEAEGIARRILALRAGEAGGAPLPFREMAILMRSIQSRRVGPIEQALRRAGVPFVISGGLGFLRRPEVVDGCALLALADDPTDEAALLRLLQSPLLRWSERRIADLFAQARRMERSAFGLLGEAGDPQTATFHAAVRDGHGRLPHAPLGQTLAALLEAVGMHLIPAKGLLEAARIRDNLERLLALAAAWESAQPLGTAREWLSRLREGALGGQRLGEEPPDPLGDALRIMTVHQAKGLEFGAVWIPGVRRQSFPAGPPGGRIPWRLDPALGFALAGTQLHETIAEVERQRSRLEERRLFYVAITRARYRVYLSATLASRGAAAQAPFLEELRGCPGVSWAPAPEPAGRPTPDAALPPLTDFEAEAARIAAARERLRTHLAAEGAGPAAPAAARRSAAPSSAAPQPPAAADPLHAYVLRWSASLRALTRSLAAEGQEPRDSVELLGLVRARRLPAGETEAEYAVRDTGRLRRGDRVLLTRTPADRGRPAMVAAATGSALLLHTADGLGLERMTGLRSREGEAPARYLETLAGLLVSRPPSPWLPWLLAEPAPAARSPALSPPQSGRPFTADGLNALQAEAVARILAGEPLILLHGPPGTGKTRTLARLAQELLARQRRVLLAAYTHAALDHALALVREAPQPAGPGLLRLGHPLTVRPALHDLLLDLSGEERSGWVRARQALEAAPLLAATVQGLHHPALDGLPPFDVLILDEATQVMEPLALRPLLLAGQALLAGDPQQLPPLVVAPAGADSAALEPLRDSLHRRWGATFPGQAVRLREQYRMNAALVRFPAEHYYEEGLVASSPAVASRRLFVTPGAPLATAPDVAAVEREGRAPMSGAERAALADPGRAIVFLAVREPEGGEGRRLAAEAARAAEAVSLLLRGGLAPAELGVIAPYRAQVSEIRSRLVAGAGRDATVDTVDRFQGAEREAIVISLCNAGGRAPELFRDPRRLNVAITRARSKLILVGDPRPPLEPGALRAYFRHLAAVGVLAEEAEPAAAPAAPGLPEALRALVAGRTAAGWEAPLEGYVLLDEQGQETAQMAELFWPRRKAAVLLPDQAGARDALERLGCRVVVWQGQSADALAAALE